MADFIDAPLPDEEGLTITNTSPHGKAPAINSPIMSIASSVSDEETEEIAFSSPEPSPEDQSEDFLEVADDSPQDDRSVQSDLEHQTPQEVLLAGEEEEYIAARTAHNVYQVDDEDALGMTRELGFEENEDELLKPEHPEMLFDGSRLKKSMAKHTKIMEKRKGCKALVGELCLESYNKHRPEFGSLVPLQEIEAHDGAIWCSEFDSTNRLLATGGQDEKLKIWRVAGIDTEEQEVDGEVHLVEVLVPQILCKEPVAVLEGHRADVVSLDWLGNNRIISASLDRSVRLWDIMTGECLHIFAHPRAVIKVVSHPTNHQFFLTCCADKVIRVWNTAKSRVVHQKKCTSMPTTVAFTKNALSVAIGYKNGTVNIYEAKSMTLGVTLSTATDMTHKSPVTGITFHDQGQQMLVSTRNNKLKVYDCSSYRSGKMNMLHGAKDLERVSKLKGLLNECLQISANFSEDGRYVVSGSEDGYVYIWENMKLTTQIDEAEPSYERFPLGSLDGICATVARFIPAQAVLHVLADIPDPTQNQRKEELMHQLEASAHSQARAVLWGTGGKGAKKQQLYSRINAANMVEEEFRQMQLEASRDIYHGTPEDADEEEIPTKPMGPPSRRGSMNSQKSSHSNKGLSNSSKGLNNSSKGLNNSSKGLNSSNKGLSNSGKGMSASQRSRLVSRGGISASQRGLSGSQRALSSSGRSISGSSRGERRMSGTSFSPERPMRRGSGTLAHGMPRVSSTGKLGSSAAQLQSLKKRTHQIKQSVPKNKCIMAGDTFGILRVFVESDFERELLSRT